MLFWGESAAFAFAATAAAIALDIKASTSAVEAVMSNAIIMRITSCAAPK